MERELEDMKATYELNQEKLQYNLKVLQEREKENKDTVTFQKRKFKRMKEVPFRTAWGSSTINVRADFLFWWGAVLRASKKGKVFSFWERL